MRKYLEVGKISVKSQITYRFDVLIGCFMPFIRVFLAYFLWRTLFTDKTEMGGMTFPMMLTYYIVCAFIQRLEQSNGLVWEFAGEIREGRFTKYLVKPVSPLGHFVFTSLGKTLYHLVFTVLAVGCVILIFKGQFVGPASAGSLILALLIAFLGLLVMILLNYLTALLAFKFTDITGWHLLNGNVVDFLSGALLPLSLLPDWMQGVMRYFPFYYMQFLPASLYLGLRTQEAFFGLLVMVIWIIVLWGLAEFLYHRFRRLYEEVGA
jgi:ABC-2 type transport system permease protein